MLGIPKLVGMSIFTLMLLTTLTTKVMGTPDFPYEAAEQLLPDQTFPQFDPANPTEGVILPQETKEYYGPFHDCTDNLTSEMEQPCNRIMLYLAGECEDNDMWLFCGEELTNYLRNHDLEDEPFLKQTDFYQDYKLLNRILVEQMAGMPFDELLAKLEANRPGLQ